MSRLDEAAPQDAEKVSYFYKPSGIVYYFKKVKDNYWVWNGFQYVPLKQDDLFILDFLEDI